MFERLSDRVVSPFGSRVPSRQRSLRGFRARGFSLIEIIVVIVIIGILATLVAPRVLSRIAQSKSSVAASNANSVAQAVQQYILDNGPPQSGASLETVLFDRSGKNAPYLENKDQLKDPWGNPFTLVIPGRKNATFDIVTYGKDGVEGGEGEDADIIKP